MKYIYQREEQTRTPLSQSTVSKLFGSPTSEGGDPASLTTGETASRTIWVGPQSLDGCGVNNENYTTRMNTILSPISNCLTIRVGVDV